MCKSADSIDLDMLIAVRAAPRKTREGEATVELLEQALAVVETVLDSSLDNQRVLAGRQHALERQTAATLAALMKVRAL